MNEFPAELFKLFKQMTLFPWQVRHLPLVTCNVSRLAASRWSTPHANDAHEFGSLGVWELGSLGTWRGNRPETPVAPPPTCEARVTPLAQEARAVMFQSTAAFQLTLVLGSLQIKSTILGYLL
jgi:hypothetical protein